MTSDGPDPRPPAADHPPLTLGDDAAARIRAEIDRAGGREVCFLAEVSDARVVNPRAVARGNRAAVLAAARDAPVGGIMIHNHPSGSLEPSDADLATAARLWEEGLGSGIVDNRASGLYVVVEPPEPREITPLDPEELEAVVAPGGALSGRHPGYEDRPGQREMLRAVSRLYNEEEVGLVEAGTGIGKSLAYLIPAAVWAAENDERTLVSTATINLQEQLVAKDLPLVRDVLDREFTWSLYKGRGNYISIRRLRLAAEQAPLLFEDDRSRELDSLLDWVRTTDDGSLSDLPSSPSDEVWEEVRSDTDICLRTDCPHFQECFYQRARRSSASADLLVVNHHLLFTDLSVRRATENFTQGAVLPPYKHVVLDEAHNVEDAATSNLGVRVTRTGLYRTLARLDRRGKGVLSAIHDKLVNRPDLGESPRLMARMEERVRPALDDARRTLGDFFGAVEPRVPPGTEARRLGSESGIPELLTHAEVAEALEGLLHALARLEREVGELGARIESDDAWRDRLDGRILDLNSLERRLAGAAATLRIVLDPEEADAAYVRWVERRGSGKRGNLVLAAAPVEPGRILGESLFEKVDSALLTSATLTTRGRFDFLRGRLGLGTTAREGREAGAGILEESGVAGAVEPADARRDRDPGEALSFRVQESVLASPFDYGRQTVFGVVTDLTGPGGTGDAFQRETARVVEELAELTGGGLFALFTSHRALRRVAGELRGRGADGRWPLFVHGEGPRARLVSRFAASGKGILLGTASFWEGVDVPGRPLRGLILQKLPFQVPTEPVVEARIEALEASGTNPFWGYMLPLAALRLKQGFGRLVRSRTDRGAILLLDDRIVSRRYGRYLRASLPPAPLVKGPWAEVRRRLEEFYGERDGTAGGDLWPGTPSLD